MGGDLQLGKNETKILDLIETITGFKIERQFRVCGYSIDGFISELNIAIEIDEKYHYNKEGNMREKDVQRQIIIENALKCKFIRIRDNVDNNKLIGIFNSQL